MRMLEILVQAAGAKALGYALAHFLWEGALTACLAALALRCFHSSRVRYGVVCVALVAMPVVFGVTFWVSFPTLRPDPAVVAWPGLPSLLITPYWASGVTRLDSASRFLPWLAPFWMAGVLVLYVRGLVNWAAARRLRHVGVCIPPDDWPARLRRIQSRLRLSRPMLLLESCLIQTPLVVGFFRPAILMPLGLLTGFPTEQVEAFLIHELAHVRRCDYLVNLAQSLVEGLLFFHPGVWWISKVIRAERENCCDDTVVALTEDPRGLAVALTLLEEHRWARSQAALAATGGNLSERVRRLLGVSRPSVASGPAVGVLLVVAGMALAAGQGKTPLRPRHVQAVTPTQVEPPPLLAQAQPPTAMPAGLTSAYDRWLNEDVVYLIDDRERAAFRSLETDAERERFIEQFWLRRDPTPGTPETEFKEKHYRRIAYAVWQFGFPGLSGWQTDRGRIYILVGPPDERDLFPKGDSTTPSPFERWRYGAIHGIGTDVMIEFVDTSRDGNYRMTRDPARR